MIRLWAGNRTSKNLETSSPSKIRELPLLPSSDRRILFGFSKCHLISPFELIIFKKKTSTQVKGFFFSHQKIRLTRFNETTFRFQLPKFKANERKADVVEVSYRSVPHQYGLCVYVPVLPMYKRIGYFS